MKFTHLNGDDTAYMVDVTARSPVAHQASAVCRVDCPPGVVQALRDGTVPKGNVLAVARVVGTSAAKRIPELLPLTRTIGVRGYAVNLSLEDDHVVIRVTVRTADRTDVEIGALTSMTMAALAIVDMVKGVDRSARIRGAKIVAKSGNRSGDWVRPENLQA